MKYYNRFGMLPQSWWGDTVTELPREIFGMLDELTRGGRHARWYELPRMVIADTTDGYEVKAALPGYDPDSIGVEVVGDFLTLRADKKSADPGENGRFIHRERSADHLEETIKLPGRVTPGGVKARYVDGVLTVTLPREVPAEPKNIKVSVER